MGNCHTICKNWTVDQNGKMHLSRPTFSEGWTQDEPEEQYATFQGTNHFDIPCPVNHILYDFESENFKQDPDQEHGTHIDGYYYIMWHQVFYRGQWKAGRPQGNGEAILSDGSVLRGFFVDGVCNGPDCLYVMKDGAYYRGGIRDQFEGQGVLKDHQVYRFEGNWHRNLPNGHGREQFGTSETYEGDFVNGSKEGKGIYTWFQSPHYSKYEGQFEASNMSGQGRLIKKNGDIIQGIFSHQNCVDKAVIKSSASKILFEGSIVQGKLSGIGKLRFSNGAVYEGQFLNGQPHGDGQVTDQNGKTQKAIWFKGKKLKFCNDLADREIEFILAQLEQQIKEQVTQKSVQHYEHKLNKSNIFGAQYQVKVYQKGHRIQPQPEHYVGVQIENYCIAVEKKV